MIDDALITFLRARESEREAKAGAVQDNSAPWDGQWVVEDNHALRTVNGHVLAHLPDGRPFKPGVLTHIADNDPCFVLDDVAANRLIINAHARDHECLSLSGSGDRSVVDGKPWEHWELEHTENAGQPCFVLRCLALRYAGHADYRAGWKP